MTIDVDYETDRILEFGYEEIIRRVVRGALEDIGCPYEAEVSVVLTDNEGIRRMNREFRNIDRATDVLSFPMLEYAVPGVFDGAEECVDPETGELMLGDIAVSVEKVAEQAEAYGHSQERELAFLVAHSMYHLFGFDHVEDGERAVMEEKQENLLKYLNINR